MWRLKLTVNVIYTHAEVFRCTRSQSLYIGTLILCRTTHELVFDAEGRPIDTDTMQMARVRAAGL